MATILFASAPTVFREAFRQVLTAYKHNVILAEDGSEAVRGVETTRFDLALLDLEIPGMVGTQVLEKIRARCPDLQVIVLASGVSAQGESRIRELGVADFLRKHLRMDVIMQAVTRTIQLVGSTPGGEKQTKAGNRAGDQTTRTGKSASILVVDDEAEICNMLSEFLTRRGYRVRIASGGKQALTMIRENQPDLMLLDIDMPDMTGVELLRQLNASPPPTNSVSVIMLTGSQEQPLHREALDLGAMDVLLKPVDLKQVELAVITKLAMKAAGS